RTAKSAAELESSANEQPLAKQARARSRALGPETDGSDSEDLDSCHMNSAFDSMKFLPGQSDDSEESDTEDIDGPFAPADDDKACMRLIDFAIRAGDDPSDEGWLPPKEAQCAAQQKNSCRWPTEYKKGPDAGSKSARTRRRYKKLLANQASLTSLGFTHSSRPHHDRAVNDSETPEPPMVTPECSPSLTQSPEPLQSAVNVAESPKTWPDGAITDDVGLAREAEEAWEDELEERERGGVEVRGWSELREQIKDDLSKRAKTIPLSHINQLLLIRNFATLRLKGLGQIEASLEIAWQWHEGEGAYFARKVRALARHFQVFEQLLVEKHGGRANALSALKDERLQLAARQWLTSQDTRLRKGVYMDGHEHEDVKKYRQEIFLPAMAAFESRMVHFEGPELHHVEPNLLPGEKRVIANWHDECCFHGNDFKTHAYLLPGQQILQKKGRGRIIHVSGFINSEDGWLVHRNKNGDVTEEAREIIYLGANGDD
ncbi:hypothetical protein OG21DRAFT_1528312, partial [Imleria badia]